VSRRLGAAVAVVVLAVVVGALAYHVGHNAKHHGQRVRAQHPVWQALARHQAELRAITGVDSLGTLEGVGQEPRIVVWVDKITPEIQKAVPKELEGFRVVVEVTPSLPPGPPTVHGVITAVTPATPGQAGKGLVGTLVIEGAYNAAGPGAGAGVSRTVTVSIPSSVQIWRPQGEGKTMVRFGDVQAGDSGQVYLTAKLSTSPWRARAADVEVYRRE
jgi:hypothetical protein